MRTRADGAECVYVYARAYARASGGQGGYARAVRADTADTIPVDVSLSLSLRISLYALLPNFSYVVSRVYSTRGLYANFVRAVNRFTNLTHTRHAIYVYTQISLYVFRLSSHTNLRRHKIHINIQTKYTKSSASLFAHIGTKYTSLRGQRSNIREMTKITRKWQIRAARAQIGMQITKSRHTKIIWASRASARKCKYTNFPPNVKIRHAETAYRESHAPKYARNGHAPAYTAFRHIGIGLRTARALTRLRDMRTSYGRARDTRYAVADARARARFRAIGHARGRARYGMRTRARARADGTHAVPRCGRAYTRARTSRFAPRADRARAGAFRGTDARYRARVSRGNARYGTRAEALRIRNFYVCAIFSVAHTRGPRKHGHTAPARIPRGAVGRYARARARTGIRRARAARGHGHTARTYGTSAFACRARGPRAPISCTRRTRGRIRGLYTYVYGNAVSHKCGRAHTANNTHTHTAHARGFRASRGSRARSTRASATASRTF